MHSKLVGHYGNVNCCAFLAEDQVHSGSGLLFSLSFCGFRLQ